MPVNATAVLNINVNDAAFKSFMGDVAKYQKLLAQSPQALKAMTKEQRELMSLFSGTVTILQQQNTLMHKLAAYAKDVKTHFEHGYKHVEKMGHRIKEVGHGVLHITEKLMKWGSIAAGLATGTGLAGFFGLDRLGEWVRRGAVSGTSVGMGFGALKSLEGEFGANMGLDIKGVAQKGAQAAEDPASEAASVYRWLGLDPRELKGSERVTGLMRALRDKFKSSGMTVEQFAQRAGGVGVGAVGLDAGGLRNIFEPDDKEFEKMVAHQQKQESKVDLDKGTIKSWKEFLTAMDDATEQIQKLLAKHLTPILKMFTENSDAWVDGLKKFMESEDFKKFLSDLPGYAKQMWEHIGTIVEGLKVLAKYIGRFINQDTQAKKDYDKKIEDLAKAQQEQKEKYGVSGADIPTIPDIVDWIAKQYGRLPKSDVPKLDPNDPRNPYSGGKGFQTGTGLDGVKQTGAYTLHKGEIVLPEKDAALLRTSGMEDWKRAISGVESGGNYGIMNTKGSGATGKYQVMPFNIGPWTKKALGYSMTQEQFRNSPHAQERVFETIFGEYVARFGNPIDAASAWFSGQPLSGNKAGPDAMGTTVPGYVKKFIAAMGGTGTGNLLGGGHMNLNVNDNTGGNVALSVSNIATTGPLPAFPL